MQTEANQDAHTPIAPDPFDAVVAGGSFERQTLLSVLTVLLLTGIWLGVFFLGSPASTGTSPGRPWAAGSILKALCDSLALNYEYPTPTGTEIKHAINGIGACLVLLLGVFSWYAAPRLLPRNKKIDPPASANALSAMSPTFAGQVLLALFVLWSFLSSQWSQAPAYAWGGATVSLLGLFWAYGIGVGVHRRHVPAVCGTLVVVCTLLAGLNLWHHAVRRPPAVTGYPIGSPASLTICIGIGLVLAVALLVFRPWKSSRLPTDATAVAIPAGLVLAILVIVAGLCINSHWPSWIGCLAGLFAVAYLRLPRRARLPITVLLLLCTAGLIYSAMIRAQRIGDPVGDTIRLRAHAWEHAATLIRKRPITGHGAGAFLLYGDALALQDDNVIHDPAAYGERPLGRSRSLWWELACETGILGMLLFAGAFAFSVVGALRRNDPGDYGWRAALIAATVAALAAETFDVNLYRPGLPSVLFVLIGVLWAYRPETGVAVWAQTRIPVAGRLAVLVGVIALAGLGLRAAVLDWQAGRDAHELRVRLAQFDYGTASVLANSSYANQLRPEARIDAAMRRIGVYSQLARQSLERGLRRIADQQAKNPADSQPTGLAIEDVAIASKAAEEGLNLTRAFCEIAQGYPGAGWELATLWDVALRSSAILNPNNAPAAYPAEARNALVREYHRRPFLPAISLRLWRTTPNLPLVEQLSILCGPMRMGRLPSELKKALVALRSRPEAQTMLSTLDTEAAKTVSGPPAEWSVWDAPELLLSRALHAAATRHEDVAVETARQALAAGGDYARRYPRAANLIREQLAKSLFWQQPAAPQQAIDALLPVLGRTPVSGEEQDQVRRVKYLLAMYTLAAGDERNAKSMLSALTNVSEETMLEQALGQLYAELANALGARIPAENRPAFWTTAISRARTLAPSSPAVLLLNASIAFESGDDNTLAEALEKCREGGLDPQRIQGVLAEALQRRPDSRSLKEFAKRFHAPASAPTGLVPSLRPAGTKEPR